MGNVLRVAGILMILTSCGDQDPGRSNLDFTGMNEFWNIAEQLSNNTEPDTADWSRLFATPGYKALMQSEFKPDYFKNYYRLAFNPRLKDSLALELKKTHWRIQYLKHMTGVLPRKEELKRHQAALLASNEITRKGLELNSPYLPQNTLSGNELPPISFVIFGNDARGYSTIVIDLLYSIEENRMLSYLIGHESHHFYRNKELTFRFPDEEDSDYDLVWVFSQLQAEGIADQIDKRVLFFDDGKMADSNWAQKYASLVDDSPTVIKKLDSLLVQYTDPAADREKIASAVRNIIPMSGHPTGYYMTRAIVENIGESELITSFGNPFAFCRLYNRVAEEYCDRFPMFSKNSVQLINSLEQNYSLH